MSETEETGTKVHYVCQTYITAQCLSNIGHDGKVVVEGPFASNQLYLEMLAVACGFPVTCSSGMTGTSAGAAMLVLDISKLPTVHLRRGPTQSECTRALQNYTSRWRNEVRVRAQ